MNSPAMTTYENLWWLSEYKPDGFTTDDIGEPVIKKLRNNGFAVCTAKDAGEENKPGARKKIHELTDKGLRAALEFEKKVEHYAKLMGFMEGDA